MKKTSAKSALTLALSSIVLAACGGAEGDGSDKSATSAGGASLPERAMILKLDGSPTQPVLAGNYFKTVISVTCGATDTKGFCLEPVQVGSMTPTFGTITHVVVGDQVEGHAGIQIVTDGSATTFVPSTSVVIDKPGVISLYVLTSGADVTPEARRWSFTMNPSLGSVSVIGYQIVQVEYRSKLVL